MSTPKGRRRTGGVDEPRQKKKIKGGDCQKTNKRHKSGSALLKYHKVEITASGLLNITPAKEGKKKNKKHVVFKVTGVNLLF